MSAATITLLPAYSPSSPVPSYSQKPAPDEQTVQQTPRLHQHPTGTYLKRSGGDAVALADQDPAAERPTYGRNAVISGFVSIDDRRNVFEVVVKLKAKMDYVLSEGGALSTKLINDSFTIWSSEKAQTSMVPSAVPFSISIPATFQDEKLVARPLPPTYEIPIACVEGFYFKSSYTLSVTISRKRRAFLDKHTTIAVPFEYHPRLRPWRPITPFEDVREDVKIIPEEFRQVSWEVTPRPKSTAAPLDLHLFLPTVEIFGIEDEIPVQIQLSGAVDALRQFLPLDDASSYSTASSSSSASNGKRGITAMLVRQITLTINGRRASRCFTIGSAPLIPLPPSVYARPTAPSLDFATSFRVTRSAKTGMFDAGVVRTQDFIVVELCPRDVKPINAYTTLRYSHPIKLVSDSWIDSSPGASLRGG